MNSKTKTRVLVVDDSALMRRLITDAVRLDSELEVVGTAGDPYEARDKILALNPDVLTLDIEMPRMDGLTFLKVLQEHRPMPVVVISSATQQGSSAALDALAAGAVEVLGKPSRTSAITAFAQQLAFRIKGAAAARCRRPSPISPPTRLRCAPPPAGEGDPRRLILLGSSTGGIEALTEVLPRLPAGLPGICIVQHLPPKFTRLVAQRLEQQCVFEVREAADGDTLGPGRALIAAGDFHLTVRWTGGAYRVALNQNPPVHHCRPAVDVLFSSALNCGAAPTTLAVLLTGMGCDGAIGMQGLKAAGAQTIAQDEQSCLVFGMPRVAIELGAAGRVLPLSEIADAITHWASTRVAARLQPVS